ncbi:T9SS type A sorting domain-containing protein [Hugenholtzia roseola]|uniref:T9SS type A sorting domain-containing protein n=1 Tax=Hugenholtzia roseola TaxID=1002 RepID=UPI0004003D8F|nr:T9SS type A sorting domain-containing protein [Hugenholtzia roseola]
MKNLNFFFVTNRNKTLSLSIGLMLSILLQIVVSASLFAEGTRELNPLGWKGAANRVLMINTNNVNTGSKFATYGADPLVRLYIRVQPGDTVYYGFGGVANNVRARIRTHQNVTVVEHNPISGMGTGYYANNNAATFNRFFVGPAQKYGAAGYDAAFFVVPNPIPAPQYGATGSADYYIEFRNNNNPATTWGDFSMPLFDITVVNAAGVEQKGRLWSREWSFTTGGSDNNHTVDAGMFVYTSERDSVVTRVDFNGMRPFGFAVSCNPTGTRNTGDKIVDRRSVFNNITTPEQAQTRPFYLIFLNNPDLIEFPSGTVGCLLGVDLDQCLNTGYCIRVNSEGGGAADILLDLNGVVGYQPNTADVLMIDVQIPDGISCIPWDGNDNLGNPVPPGTEVPITVSFFTGLTHLPISDVENHNNGFSVALIRPISNICNGSFQSPRIYWDDTLINTGTALDGNLELAGCDPATSATGGCHRWTGRGNNDNPETVNTWWFVNEQRLTVEIPLIDPNFDILSSLDNATNCTFANGDFVTITVGFSNGYYYANDLSHNLTSLNPNVTFNLLSNDTTDNSFPTRSVTLTYQLDINTPPTNTVENLIFLYQVSAISQECGEQQDNQREFDCQVILPVELVEFKAQKYDNFTLLNWNTSSERDNEGFEIQKSTDGVEFYPIGFVKGHNTTTLRKFYQFKDEELNTQTAYYRLKQRDYAGTFSLSKVVSVAPNSKIAESSLSLYPNPAYTHFNLEWASAKDETALITLYTPTGKIAFQGEALKKVGEPLQIQTQDFARGLYLLQIYTPSGIRFHQKVILK